MTRRTNSECDVDTVVEEQVLQHLPQPFPTPGASPGVPLVDAQRRVSTACSHSIGQTPHSDDSYLMRWVESKPWTPHGPPSESIADLGQRIRERERVTSTEKSPSTDFFHQKPSVSSVTAHGRCLVTFGNDSLAQLWYHFRLA